jgi:hypothetical protein
VKGQQSRRIRRSATVDVPDVKPSFYLSEDTDDDPGDSGDDIFGVETRQRDQTPSANEEEYDVE